MTMFPENFVKHEVLCMTRSAFERSWRWGRFKFHAADEAKRWGWCENYKLVMVENWQVHAPDIQNEILKTMAMVILREVVEMITV